MKRLWRVFAFAVGSGALGGWMVYVILDKLIWARADLAALSLSFDTSRLDLIAGILSFAGFSTTILVMFRTKREIEAGVKISRPAGHMFTRVLTFFISKRLFYKHFGQTIADNREEVNKALARGDVEEADKIARELNIDLARQILELFLGLPASIVGKVWQIAKGKEKGDE